MVIGIVPKRLALSRALIIFTILTDRVIVRLARFFDGNCGNEPRPSFLARILAMMNSKLSFDILWGYRASLNNLL